MFDLIFKRGFVGLFVIGRMENC